MILALYERERSGKGQWVHTSLIEAQIFMLDFQAARWLIAGEVPPQAGNDHPTGIPTGVFPTSDGHINIAASGDNLYERCCKALGVPELITHPDYKTGSSRSKNRKVLNALLAERTKTNTSAHWIAALNKAGVPCGPINSIDQTFAEPQVKHLGIARKVRHKKLGELRVVGQPINMSRYPQPETLGATPELGEHNTEVLSSLGYGEVDIKALKTKGVV
jgi:formyl-CoA transferase